MWPFSTTRHKYNPTTGKQTHVHCGLRSYDCRFYYQFNQCVFTFLFYRMKEILNTLKAINKMMIFCVCYCFIQEPDKHDMLCLGFQFVFDGI